MVLIYHLLFFTAVLMVSDGEHVNIIHGKEVEPHSRPYMVLIRTKENKQISTCTGTFIGSNWVLTAAHCTAKINLTTVTLGAHSITAEECEKQEIGVIGVFRYQTYNSKTLLDDIMILKLVRKAKLNSAVKALPLPKTFEDVKRNTVCEAAGWGWTKKGKLSDVLLKVNLTVMDRMACEKYWRHWSTRYVIKRDMICVNVGPNGEDTCKGDSGSPLICNGIFRGINSFGYFPCGTPYTSNVYTRLTEKYISWIKTITGNTD